MQQPERSRKIIRGQNTNPINQERKRIHSKETFAEDATQGKKESHTLVVPWNTNGVQAQTLEPQDEAILYCETSEEQEKKEKLEH